eukprot:jgi/Psemu1/31030/gm1.31030_g
MEEATKEERSNEREREKKKQIKPCERMRLPNMRRGCWDGSPDLSTDRGSCEMTLVKVYAGSVRFGYVRYNAMPLGVRLVGASGPNTKRQSQIGESSSASTNASANASTSTVEHEHEREHEHTAVTSTRFAVPSVLFPIPRSVRLRLPADGCCCRRRRRWYYSRGPNNNPRRRASEREHKRNRERAPEPGLSGQNRRDLLILATGVCGAIGYGFYYGGNDWDAEVGTAKHRLLKGIHASSIPDRGECGAAAAASVSVSLGSDCDNSGLQMQMHTHTPAFRRYLDSALPRSLRFGSNSNSNSNDSHEESSPTPTIATVVQSGEFYAARQWYPFEATLTASMVPDRPGFVWDARTTIVGLPHSVLECLLPSERIGSDDNDNDKAQPKVVGSIVTKAWGKYPLIEVEEDDPYVLFWLAMTPLFPSVFGAAPRREDYNENEYDYDYDYENGIPNRVAPELAVGNWNWNSTTTASSDGTACGGQAQLLCDDGEHRAVEFVVGCEFEHDADRDRDIDIDTQEEGGGVPLLRRIVVTSLHPSDDDNDDDALLLLWQATYGDYEYRQCPTAAPFGHRRAAASAAEEDGGVGVCVGLGQEENEESVPLLLWRVPTTIEIGKGQGDDYQPRFRIRNHHIEYSTRG